MAPKLSENEAKSKIGALGRKYPDATRKGWEARKEFAQQCGVDVKVFKKGLGPQYNRLSSLIKGVNEVNALVPADARSFKAFAVEKAKMDAILKAYRQLVTPNLNNKKVVEYYGWFALDAGLANMESWADRIAKQAADFAKSAPARG